MRTKNDSPCDKECPERSIGCHGSCAKYAAYAAQRTTKREDQQRNAAWTMAKTEAYRKGKKFRAVNDRGT